MRNSKQNNQLKLFKLPLWKRIFDIVFSLIAIFVLSPLFVIIAGLIWFEDKGKVFYSQKRTGSNFKIFNFYKFRSMYTDADKRLKELSKLNQYEIINEETNNIDFQNITVSEKGIIIDNNTLINDEVVINDEGIISKNNLLFGDDYSVVANDFAVFQKNNKENSFKKLENDPRITKSGRFIRKYSIDELPQLFNIIVVR